MTDSAIRLNQLEQILDPTGGFGLVDLNDQDLKTPVEKMLLAASSLSDDDKNAVLAGLNTINAANINSLAPSGLTKYVMSLLAGIQYQGISIDEIQSWINRLDDRSLRQSKGIQNFFLGVVALEKTIIAISKTNEEHNLKVKRITDYLLTAIHTLKNDSLREDEQAKLKGLLGVQIASQPLMLIDGIDPTLGVGTGSSGGDPVLYASNIVMPEPKSLIKIEITSANGVPNTKNDPPIIGGIKLTVDGQVWQGFSIVGVQGASSAGYPKKNLTVAFYTDVAGSIPIKLKIGNLIPHDTFAFKANWIDQTQARNLLCYRFWDLIRNTRKTWPRNEADAAYIGKTGVAAFPTGAVAHPLGFPCEMYFNGEFYGIGTFLQGQLRPNYNVNKTTQTDLVITLDDHVDMVNFASGYTIQNPKVPGDVANAIVADWKSFLVMSQDDFTKNFDTYLDRANIVDFYLFILFLNAYDCTDKNTTLISFNSKKWYFCVYDLDTTLGLNWAGGSTGGETSDTFNYDRNGKEFWQKMMTTCNADIKTRYAELRKSGIFSIETIYNLYMNISTKYPADVVQAEFNRWPTLPSWKQSTFDQINAFLVKRLPWMDAKFGYTGK